MRPHSSGSSFSLPQFQIHQLDVEVFETVLSLELSVSAGASIVYPDIPARNLRVVLVSLISPPSPGFSVSIEDFPNAVHISPLLLGPPHIVSLEHRLYSATIQPSLTASDQDPGSLTLTQVPSRQLSGMASSMVSAVYPQKLPSSSSGPLLVPRTTTSSPSAQLSCFHL